jgi:hypothetical protein
MGRGQIRLRADAISPAADLAQILGDVLDASKSRA